MDIFEKINRAFGGWYEGLFGSGEDVRPKDILRKILTALEENRKEGFDNKVYVPNQYILEIAVEDEEEKDYLYSFLDRDELETAVRRYCQQNHYHIRGVLDFTIKEVEPGERARREKVRVRCRYNAGLAASRPQPGRAPQPSAEENPTVFGALSETGTEMGTVPAIASARLIIHPPGKPAYEVAVTRGVVTIGRSSKAGNDIVLAEDGMVSRRHARMELDADGRFTLYDLDTTNGTRVNDRRIQNRTLHSGDVIQVGATKIEFHQEREAEGPRERNVRGAGHTVVAASNAISTARLILMDGEEEIDDFILGSETVIGRGTTNEIVLSDRSVATRHARLTRGSPSTLEALAADYPTQVNGELVLPGSSVPIRSGDRITLGSLTLRFEERTA